MKYSSLNTSAIFSICMCCGSIIYGLNITRASEVIPQADINRIPSSTVVGLNARVFTAEMLFWRFGVHLACFISGLGVYSWVHIKNILVGTWWRFSNRRVYNIN